MISYIQSLFKQDCNLFNRFCDSIIATRLNSTEIFIRHNDSEYFGEFTITGKIFANNIKYESLGEWYQHVTDCPAESIQTMSFLKNIWATQKLNIHEVLLRVNLSEASQFKDSKYKANSLFMCIYRYLYANNLQNEYKRSAEYDLLWNNCTFRIVLNRIKEVYGANLDGPKIQKLKDLLLKQFYENNLKGAMIRYKGNNYPIFEDSELVQSFKQLSVVHSATPDSPRSIEVPSEKPINVWKQGLSGTALDIVGDLKKRIEQLETGGFQKLNKVSEDFGKLNLPAILSLMHGIQQQISEIQTSTQNVLSEVSPLQARLAESDAKIAELSSEIRELKERQAELESKSVILSPVSPSQMAYSPYMYGTYAPQYIPVGYGYS